MGELMGGKWDDLIETLSGEILKVPQEVIDAARKVVDADSGTTLADELNRRGCLSDLEHGFLQEVTARLSDPDGLTGTDVRSSAPSCGDADPAERGVPSLTSGDEDRYVRMGEHERGGMGRILNVWDTRMGREVALKELLPDRIERSKKDSDSSAGRTRVLRRFLQEAQVTGRLQHPSIIPVHEIGQRADGSYYYTMKFVRGETLRDAIERRASLEERLKLLPHFIDLCQAMAYAHANGIIHRDLKPENVMVGEFGETLVIDWGLSKSVGGAAIQGNVPEGVETAFDLAANDGLTVEGTVMGTPYYMAPEQAAGRLDELDGRTDVYALGAVLYQLLTGERPFANLSKMDALRKLNEGAPASLTELCPELPRALGAICNQAMARNPAERYQTAREMADEIITYQGGGLVGAHDYGLGEHIRRFVAQHVAAFVTATVAFFVLIGVVIYAFRAVQHRADAERAARLVAERTNDAMKINDAYRMLEDLDYDAVESRLQSFEVGSRGWPWGHLFFAVNSKFQRLSQHGEYSQSKIDFSNIDISADGRYILTADDRGCVNWWSLTDDRIESTIQTHVAKLLDVRLYPGGAFFASSAYDGEVCVWEIESGKQVAQTYVGGQAREVDFSAEGDEVLVAGPGGVTVWNWRDDVRLGSYWGDGDQLNTVEVSRDGHWVAAGDEIGMFYLWNRQSGERVVSAMAHPRADTGNYWGVLDVSFRPGHDQVATAGSDGTVSLWNYEGGVVDTFPRFEGKIWSVNWYPDGERFIGIDHTGVARTQLADSRIPVVTSIALLGQEVAIVPDSAQLLLAEYGRTILGVRPDETGGRFFSGHHSGLNDLCFASDGRTLYSVAGREAEAHDTRVLAWEIPSFRDQPIWYPESVNYGYKALDAPQPSVVPKVLFGGLAKRGTAMGLHPSGAFLTVGDGGGSVWFLDLPGGGVRRKIAIPEWGEGIQSLAFSPDGREIVVAGRGADPGRSVKVFDVKSGRFLRQIGLHQLDVTHVDYDPQGRYIATGAGDRMLALWDLHTGKNLKAFEGLHERGVYAFHLSHNGDQILAVETNNGVAVLRPFQKEPSGQLLPGRPSKLNASTMSPDGTCIVAAHTNETVVWDAEARALLFALPHGASRVKFSPDGRTLATAGLDGRLGLWHSLPWK